jgi:hypothetical protein
MSIHAKTDRLKTTERRSKKPEQSGAQSPDQVRKGALETPNGFSTLAKA